jgi:spoIIIJ-associated protein
MSSREAGPVVESTLKEILDAADFSYTGIVRSDVAGQAIFAIRSDEAGSLIGVHGDTVHALDHLVKKIVEKRLHVTRKPSDEAGVREWTEEEDELHFLVDVNDYRTKQIKDLQNKALMMAERARSFQYDVELSPMSAYGCLIVHTTLQDQPNVKTESQGEGRNRRVVIRYTQ